MTPILRGARLALWTASHGKPRVAYVGGWLGHDNLGDEALFNACKAIFPGISLYPMRGCRQDMTLARVTRAFHIAMLAGGTIINKNNDSLKRAERMLDVAEHRFVFGTGVADPSFWQGRTLNGGVLWSDNLSSWRAMLEQCDYVGVRGPLSQRILREAGLAQVEVVGDPVLAFADCTRGREPEDKTLGLNLGGGAGHVWGDSEESVFQRFVALASRARDAGWKVVWFVVWPRDYPLTKDAAQQSGTGEHIHAIYTDHRPYLDLASKLCVFVGMKLHAVVLATCVGVPSLMLEYRPKCRDYMESIRQGHLCKRVDLATAENLWDQVLEVYRSREACAREVSEGVTSLQAFQEQRAREIGTRMKAACGASA